MADYLSFQLTGEQAEVSFQRILQAGSSSASSRPRGSVMLGMPARNFRAIRLFRHSHS